MVIDECGHWVPDEQPEKLAGHLRSFFQQSSPRLFSGMGRLTP